MTAVQQQAWVQAQHRLTAIPNGQILKQIRQLMHHDEDIWVQKIHKLTPMMEQLQRLHEQLPDHCASVKNDMQQIRAYVQNSASVVGMQLVIIDGRSGSFYYTKIIKHVLHTKIIQNMWAGFASERSSRRHRPRAPRGVTSSGNIC
jgi:hypothetical protein